MTDRKPSIDDQIATVRQLIDAEINHIERKVSRGFMTEAKMRERLAVLDAVSGTLSFVRKYADGFRAYIEAQRAFEREREAELAALEKAADDGEEAA